MKRKLLYTILMPAVLMLLSGCKDEQFTVPAFIHMDAMTLKLSDANPPFPYSEIYTSDIVATYVVAHIPGKASVDTLGLFTLPFTAPVLYDGTLDYIQFYPAVQQSGSSKALPFYTFYNSRRKEGVTLHSGDTLNFGIDTTTYNLSSDDVLMFQIFEPWEGMKFDSVMTLASNVPDEACTGNGYGRVHISSNEASKDFCINGSYTVTDPTKLLYLELDTRSDMAFEVYMHSSYQIGGTEEKLPVMVVRASKDWQHLYINLGRTWSYFNHTPNFRISFSALNIDGIEGDIRFDNVRLLTTSVVL